MKEKEGYLDSAHTHFLLYDDGQTAGYGGEINFRTAFENHATKESGSTNVLVVLNGGCGMLRTIFKDNQIQPSCCPC